MLQYALKEHIAAGASYCWKTEYLHKNTHAIITFGNYLFKLHENGLNYIIMVLIILFL